MLADIGRFAAAEGVKLLAAVSDKGDLIGGVVYFGNMAAYGSGGIATPLQNASGIRLLGVDARFRNAGAGKSLTQACIQLAKVQGHSQVILHTTHAMRVAWLLYERLGFEWSEELDFMQGELLVFGFRLRLN